MTGLLDDRAIFEAVGEVPDPEVPVLTIADLGVLRGVRREGDEVVVTITPTYSGCPAMDLIKHEVELTLRSLQLDGRVETVLSPAWTTDWMSDEGKAKLTEYGIAPPTGRSTAGGPVALNLTLRCPLCGSPDTSELSRFGSTSCKSLWRCNSCREPFDHFKVI
ncbi:1,2-phenylacetyl-CoA epoxidase subunit PaaD [Kribbella sp. CA-293567]|uniref:1,2-phenylacetyl-CoA epoxidase subunit PaaD n=1 Tax=Kribbella sp. CA-293567 TaxID=3002436 RepID=UPI0022DE8EC5|nr:1,2-phenylacetyl-CoA epoxidase subunit PaaD [Kribbella sp. CA-293567]WBQ02499.1 phenylacetate-CoA oxygenase subunit PaaJ [Kribbella sp. CA-293567]